MDNLTELYCHIDDFYQQFKPEFDAHLIATGRQRLRACKISVSEMTNKKMPLGVDSQRHLVLNID